MALSFVYIIVSSVLRPGSLLMTGKIVNSTILTLYKKTYRRYFTAVIAIFPRVKMGSDFYYIKVKVIFPEDGVVKEFYYEKILSYYHYH